jgi:D-alanyl-D-alanine carboxypeptidase (penicillin-binding protein 5/6)
VEQLLDTGFSILHRRDLGERIEVAQNLFDPADNGAGPSAAPAQATSSRIVLSDAELASLRAADGPAHHPVAEPVVAPVAAQPRARLIRVKAEAEAGRHHRAEGDWRVQVGAYHNRQQAQAQIAVIAQRYAEAFDGAEGRVFDAGHRRFNARFVGLSAITAKDACRALKAHGQACMALAPES